MKPIPPAIRAALAVLLVITVYYVCRTGPLQAYDTVSYLDHAANREPVYPLLLDLFGFVFRSKAYFFLVFFQTLAVLAACLYLTRTLHIFYGLPAWGVLLCFVLTALPLYFLRIGNYLLTEAVTYSIFLFSAAWVAEAVRLKTSKALLISLALIMAGTLVRPQMIVMYLIFICVVAYLAFLKRSWRTAALLSCALLGALALGGLSNRIYHAYFNQAFQSTKGAGLYLAAGALYVSDKSDLEAFRGEKYFPLMVSVYEQMDKDRLFSLYRYDTDQNLAGYFYTARGRDNRYLSRTNVIYWYILAKKTYLYLAKGDAAAKWEDDLNGIVRKKEFNADGKRWNEMDALCFDIFRKIVSRRGGDYLKFQGSMLRYHFTLVELCFYGSLCLLFLFHYTEVNILISIFTVFNLANLSLIGSTGVYIPRAYFYSYVLQGVCLLLLAVQYRPKRSYP